MRYARVPDVRVEPLGLVWAAYSPKSGETVFINDAGAALLEILDAGVSDAEEVVRALAQDSGAEIEDVRVSVTNVWARLIDSGMIRDVGGTPQAL